MKNKEKLLDAIDILVYLLLGIIMIVRGLTTNGNTVMKIVFFVLALVFIIVGVLFARQKSLYKEALNALNEELNVEKACACYEKIVKHDFLKNYTRQRGFFDLMVMLELNEMEKVKWLIEMNEKQFDSNDDMKMIKYYYLMRAELYLGNNNEVNKAYNELSKILNKGLSSSFFVKEDVEAIKALSSKRYSDALRYFEQIDLSKLNNKDKKWVLKNLVNLSTGKTKKEYESQLKQLTDNRRDA